MATRKKADTNDNGLNIAGRVAAYFIDSKLTMLIVLVAVLAGLMAMLNTPREENPKLWYRRPTSWSPSRVPRRTRCSS